MYVFHDGHCVEKYHDKGFGLTTRVRTLAGNQKVTMKQLFGNCQQFMVIFIRRKYNAKEFMANGIPFGIHDSFYGSVAPARMTLKFPVSVCQKFGGGKLLQ